MNPVIIILGVVIAILIYVLYTYFSTTSTQLSSVASLKTATLPDITSINNPTNTRYGYSIWVYVNSWDNSQVKTIFSRAGNISLNLSQNAPTLNCNIVMSDNTIMPMVITDNFPLQKWVCIAISVDNQFVDAYLEGKLVKSQRCAKLDSSGVISAMPKVPGDSSVPIKLGNLPTVSVAAAAAPGGGTTPAPPAVTTLIVNPFDAYIADFKRWTSPIDPQTAWSTYMSGNGGNGVTKALTSYGVNVSVLKNNIEQSKFSLL